MMARPILLARLRHRAMTARTRTMRAYWKRALARHRRRYLSRTSTVDGVPTMRGLALLLEYARAHGWTGHLVSSDRRKGVAERFGHKSQAQLYDDWRHRRPGANPANPPGRSSHELRSDGSAVFRRAPGRRLPWWQLGMDVTQDGQLVAILRAHDVDARHPYSTPSEQHHVNVITDPTDILVGLGEA